MVKVRQHKEHRKSRSEREGWEVDIRAMLPDGTKFRERVKAPVSSRSDALRWGRAREAFLLQNGGKPKETASPEVPTLGVFWPRFMEGYAEANKEKPNHLATRKRIWRKHLEPAFGAMRLDAISDEAVQRFKGRLAKLSNKSINNVLTNLRRCLAVAVEWKVIPATPCRIRQLKAARPIVSFYEEAEYERLVEAAAKQDTGTLVAVLLGGEAGLRLGEILALEWPDVDTQRGLLKVQRAVSDDGSVTLPKGGRPRIVPTTVRLRDALARHRHLRGDRVITGDDGTGVDKWALKWMVDVAERRAGLRKGGRLHILRHTFCSRLASRNVPMLSIKELAGHQSLETTQRYMHLSAAAPREAIKALETRGAPGEPGPAEETKASDDA
jgi:integrase